MIRVIHGRHDEEISFADAAARLVECVAEGMNVSVAESQVGVEVIDGDNKLFSLFLATSTSANAQQQFEPLLNLARIIRMIKKWQVAREYPHAAMLQYLAGRRPIPPLPTRRPTSALEVATYVTGWLLGRNVAMPDKVRGGAILAMLIVKAYDV